MFSSKLVASVSPRSLKKTTKPVVVAPKSASVVMLNIILFGVKNLLFVLYPPINNIFK